MEKFTLRYEEDGEGGLKTIEFDAPSTAHALELAKQSAPGRQTELLKDGKTLCTMRLIEKTGVWRIEPSAG